MLVVLSTKLPTASLPQTIIPEAHATTYLTLNITPKNGTVYPGWRPDREIDAGVELAVLLTFGITQLNHTGTLDVEGVDAYGNDASHERIIFENRNYTTPLNNRYSNITRIYVSADSSFLIQVYVPEVITWDENNGEYMVLGGLLGGFAACALTAIFFVAAITRRRKDVVYRS